MLDKADLSVSTTWCETPVCPDKECSLDTSARFWLEQESTCQIYAQVSCRWKSASVLTRWCCSEGSGMWLGPLDQSKPSSEHVRTRSADANAFPGKCWVAGILEYVSAKNVSVYPSSSIPDMPFDRPIPSDFRFVMASLMQRSCLGVANLLRHNSLRDKPGPLMECHIQESSEIKALSWFWATARKRILAYVSTKNVSVWDPSSSIPDMGRNGRKSPFTRRHRAFLPVKSKEYL